MRARMMYCGGCDREVHVLATDDVPEDAQANIPPPELVCLDIGEWCSGNLCPLGAAAPSAMVTRLIRNGLPLDHLKTVRGYCDSCGMDNDLALYGRDMAACLVCGTSRAAGA